MVILSGCSYWDQNLRVRDLEHSKHTCIRQQIVIGVEEATAGIINAMLTNVVVIPGTIDPYANSNTLLSKYLSILHNSQIN